MIKIYALLAILCLAVSCRKEGAESITLTSNTQAVLLNNKNAEAEALFFTFPVTQDLQSTLQLDIEDDHFLSPVEIPIGKNCMSHSFSNRELNRIIVENWDWCAGETTTFAFRLKVRESLSNVVTVNIKSYGSFQPSMIIIGSSLAINWDVARGIQMNSNDKETFWWTGEFDRGEIRFSAGKGQSADQFMSDVSGTRIERHTGNLPYRNFQIPDWAKYNITLNTVDCSITIKMLEYCHKTAVFFGDSITQCWDGYSTYLTDHHYLNSGISGQTTHQILTRIDRDVLKYRPRVTIILAGINDIAQNEGYISNEGIMNNLISIAEQVKACGSNVVLCSLLPIDGIWWRPEFDLQECRALILDMNSRIKSYCAENGHTYLDYYSALVNQNGGIGQYSDDGLHPNLSGYRIMESLVEPIISQLLSNQFE